MPDDTKTAARSLAEMTAEVVDNNKAKGWHDNPPSLPECMMMLVTEAAEVVEAWRRWGTDDVTDDPIRGLPFIATNSPRKPEGVGSEMADIFIRLLDDCHLFGIDLQAEFNRKMAYNRTRSFRHGGKAI